jgi:hypothetical protein
MPVGKVRGGYPRRVRAGLVNSTGERIGRAARSITAVGRP